jgi:hypothetical protein
MHHSTSRTASWTGGAGSVADTQRVAASRACPTERRDPLAVAQMPAASRPAHGSGVFRVMRSHASRRASAYQRVLGPSSRAACPGPSAPHRAATRRHAIHPASEQRTALLADQVEAHASPPATAVPQLRGLTTRVRLAASAVRAVDDGRRPITNASDCAYSARNAATALWVCSGRSICGTCPQSSST